ncbi:MAG: amidohydrolase family protein [Pseudomonadota bacterium]
MPTQSKPLLALIVLLSLLLSVLSAKAQTHDQALIFENVRLVDIDSATVGSPQRLMVAGGAIVDSLDESGARVVDAEGLFLIPGLAEMHAHVPNTQNVEQVQDVLNLFLAHGVTTIRGMLGEPGHLTLRAELASGQRTGPRLITSGPSLNGNSVSSVEQAVRLVRNQSEAGYDFLKLHPGLWPETFDTLTRTADGLGMDYAGHVSLAVGLDRALASNQATIDHLDGYAQALVPPDHPAANQQPGFFGMAIAHALDSARIEAVAERTHVAGAWNVPTQTLIENIAVNNVDELMERPAMRWVPDGLRQQWSGQITQLRAQHSADDLGRFVDMRRKLIAALHEADAGLLLGADAPQIMNVPGDSTHHELALLVASGLAPAEALATGTTKVAHFLDQPAHACLAPGCVADLVLLQANPLENIDHTRAIAGVMRAGRWFDRAALDAMLADIEQRANPTGPG